MSDEVTILESVALELRTRDYRAEVLGDPDIMYVRARGFGNHFEVFYLTVVYLKLFLFDLNKGGSDSIHTPLGEWDIQDPNSMLELLAQIEACKEYS